MANGIPRRMTGFGPGNLIEKWLNAYGEGDVNHPENLKKWKHSDFGWVKSAPQSGKYLTYIKSLTGKWPHLELLADFMDVGTTPVRWNPDVPGGYPADNTARQKEKDERMGRANVTVLEYPSDGRAPSRRDFKMASSLQSHIDKLDREGGADTKLRLFVVEDLSREVIETLGAHYDVDPLFFREHLVDYVWYNIKDWWRDPPNLDIVSRGQNWFQMRYSRARYFEDKDAFTRGEAQVRNFNVYRQLQSDFNHSRFWDKVGHNEAKIGHLRSRATFWINRPDDKKPSVDTEGQTEKNTQQENSTARQPTIGILLLDPTIEEGHPLWRQYRNWDRVPSMAEQDTISSEVGPPQGKEGSFFNEFIYWASRPEVFKNVGPRHDHDIPPTATTDPPPREPSPVCIPAQALLHTVCNEWLTLIDYIKTRMNQVDWEIAFPGNFLAKDEQIEKALSKLHYWRRVVPVYRAMLTETFLRVFREAKHPDRMHPGRGGGGGGGGGGGMLGGGGGGGPGASEAGGWRGPLAQGTAAVQQARPDGALDGLLDRECINAYKQDYTLVLNYLEEYQARIDRLTEVVTAVISIQDSRRGYKDNKNLQWLTWLATFFIPLSFVATMLSMTTGPLDQLHDAAIMWAEVSIPSGLLIMSFVLLMSIAKCRRAIRRFFSDFPWAGRGGRVRPFEPFSIRKT